MIQIIIVVAYFSIILGISLYISRKNKDIADFLVGKQQLGLLAIIPMLFSELIAGSATVGNAATAYKLGISALWYNFGLALGCILSMVFVSEFYYVMACRGKMSVGESLSDYFDKKTGTVMVMITGLVYTIIFSLQPSAAASIIAPMLGISETLCHWLVGGSFILIAMLGGIKGVAKVNFIHAFIMFFGMIFAALLSLRYIGGISVLPEKLPAEYFDLFRPGLLTTIAWVAGASINLPAGSMVAGVIMGSRNLKAARKGFILVAVLIIPFAFSVVSIGLCAKAINLPVVENDVIYTMTSAISPVVAGISSMAILAAILSTAPVLLMMVGAVATRDIYKQFINKDATDKQQLVLSKVTIIAVGIIGTYLGLSGGTLLGRLLGAMQIRSAAGLVLMVAMVWKRVDNRAAFWSILTGGSIASVWFFAGNPFGIEPLWPSLIIAGSTLIILTLTSKDKVYKGYLAYDKIRQEIHKEG